MFFKKKSKRGLKGGAQRTYTDGTNYISERDEMKRVRFSTDELYDDLDDEDFGERFDAEDFDANFIDAGRGASENFKAYGSYENFTADDEGVKFAKPSLSENFSAQTDFSDAERSFSTEFDADFAAKTENFAAIDAACEDESYRAQEQNFISQGADFAPAAERDFVQNERKNFKERLNFINPFSPFKQIFSAIALIVCVVLAGIFVGDVLFGKRSFEVLRRLQQEKAFLFTDVERLKKENAELQKLYLERRSLDPDLKK